MPFPTCLNDFPRSRSSCALLSLPLSPWNGHVVHKQRLRLWWLMSNAHKASSKSVCKQLTVVALWGFTMRDTRLALADAHCGKSKANTLNCIQLTHRCMLHTDWLTVACSAVLGLRTAARKTAGGGVGCGFSNLFLILHSQEQQASYVSQNCCPHYVTQPICTQGSWMIEHFQTNEQPQFAATDPDHDILYSWNASTRMLDGWTQVYAKHRVAAALCIYCSPFIQHSCVCIPINATKYHDH